MEALIGLIGFRKPDSTFFHDLTGAETFLEEISWEGNLHMMDEKMTTQSNRNIMTTWMNEHSLLILSPSQGLSIKQPINTDQWHERGYPSELIK